MRDQVKVDLVSIASGGVIAAVGVLLLLDSSGALDISPGWMAVALTGAVGVILVLIGILNGGGKRHD
jgi:hypothetical protein